MRKIPKLEKNSGSLMVAALGRLHLRELDKCKTKALKENKGNFDNVRYR